jgi:hypothetical protein
VSRGRVILSRQIDAQLEELPISGQNQGWEAWGLLTFGNSHRRSDALDPLTD